MKQETTAWQWYQLDHMQIIFTLLLPSSQHSNFYRPDALCDVQPIELKQ